MYLEKSIFQFPLVTYVICQVFVHDPLYKWALSPLKALQRQKVIENILIFLMVCTTVF